MLGLSRVSQSLSHRWYVPFELMIFWSCFNCQFDQGIQSADLISIRYLSEIDEALISLLNSSPSPATSACSVLHLCNALVVHRPNIMYWPGTEPQLSILVLHGIIFSFICDDIQWMPILSFTHKSFSGIQSVAPMLLFDFLSDPQRSRHHAVDKKMHNSVTERCFSYIFNHRPTHFPGVRRWARKSTRRPWLWRWQKPKGVITNVNSQFRWQRDEYLGCTKKLQRFWAVVLALKYLPFLLHQATRSEELIALAKMWLDRPFLLSLFPHDAKMAGKAVRRYLFRIDGNELFESITVGLLLLCIV